MSFKKARVRRLNDHATRADGAYVLYWMQMARRMRRNHALDYALAASRTLGVPLVIYEGLRLDYPWASRRLHRFILEGMLDNARDAALLGLTYWPFVEAPGASGRGLLRKLARKAALVVTDDFPCFIVPKQSAALAQKTDAPVHAVDGNCVVPLSLLGAPVSAAAHLRHRIHKLFPEAWAHRANTTPAVHASAKATLAPPFPLFAPRDLSAFLGTLPVDAAVPEVPGVRGGSAAAQEVLDHFIAQRLRGYATLRSPPVPAPEAHTSKLSPYLHFGHIAIEDVVDRVLNAQGDWSPLDIDDTKKGKREGYYTRDADAGAFLDEAITWRDTGFQWHFTRHADTVSLPRALPTWALETLKKHAPDPRPHVYELEALEAGQTHDALWNAAQSELVKTGAMQNYLRMLWGKKVLEWSRTPDEAYTTLVHLNNKYALDGRNPNSYTGILWCFGLFDRPWPPERPIFGSVRYMSSDNTARKFKVRRYLAWVAGL